MDARAHIEAIARRYGFRTVRFGRLGPTPRLDVFDHWLAAGRHGDMGYLERGRDERADPESRLPGAKSVVVLAQHYHHRRPPDPGGLTGMVARYAWGRDYHNLMGKRVKKLRRDLRADGIRSWGGVDTAPILERAWAEAVGVGYSGKNCLQIIPATTSWFFLGVIFVDAEVEPDPPVGRDHCGSCTRCLVACPTDAFVGPHELDSRSCIAYWTIEAQGLPPVPIREGLGRWAFGCDICQEVCPHNASPPDPDEDDLLPRHGWLDLAELITSDDDALMRRFLGTPLRRPRAEGLKRNALLVLGNLRDPAGIEPASIALYHPSPIVRGAAVWALRRMGATPRISHPHPIVAAELDRELPAPPRRD